MITIYKAGRNPKHDLLSHFKQMIDTLQEVVEHLETNGIPAAHQRATLNDLQTALCRLDSQSGKDLHLTHDYH